MQDNFIKDMVRMYLHDAGIGAVSVAAGGSVDKQAIEDAFRMVPLKELIKIRWLYIRMRHTVPGTEKFKKLEGKLNTAMQRYGADWSEKKLGGAITPLKTEKKGDGVKKES